MRMGVGFSIDLDPHKAAADAAQVAADRSGGPDADLALVFATHHHDGAFVELLQAVQETVRPAHLIGCTGESLVANDREIEGEPAVVVWLAHMPGVNIKTFSIDFEQTPEGPAFLGFPDELPEAPPGGSSLMILLGEPFSLPADVLLNRLNEDHPGLPVVGGMASGGFGPERNRVFLGTSELAGGAVAAHLSGNFKLQTVVSQGCRPIGKPFVITKANEDIIFQLGGKPAWEQLKTVLDDLPPEDRELLKQGLHVGRAIDEYREGFRRGDFLIRNFRGYDPDSGAIAVDDMFRVGQTIRFHLRDRHSADEDLREMLAPAGSKPAGGLLFSCNGRGSRLFRMPDHDAGEVRRRHDGLPLAGFFAQGELGPVGGRNFMHGFTASIALLGT